MPHHLALSDPGNHQRERLLHHIQITSVSLVFNHQSDHLYFPRSVLPSLLSLSVLATSTPEDNHLFAKEHVLMLDQVARLQGSKVRVRIIGFNLTLTHSLVPATTVTWDPAQNVSRPLRIVTLLIEDMRSGVPDLQLAEVRVPLKVADDPEDGFWADATEICDALQSGPSRIDGRRSIYAIRS